MCSLFLLGLSLDPVAILSRSFVEVSTPFWLQLTLLVEA